MIPIDICKENIGLNIFVVSGMSDVFPQEWNVNARIIGVGSGSVHIESLANRLDYTRELHLLFFCKPQDPGKAPERMLEGWVNVYLVDGALKVFTDSAYPTKGKAESSIVSDPSHKHVGTVQLRLPQSLCGPVIRKMLL